MIKFDKMLIMRIIYVTFYLLSTLAFADHSISFTASYTDAFSIQNEKKIVAVFDSYDGSSYNFIAIDEYDEEFFFIADQVAAEILKQYDLKSAALNGVSFEIEYKEEASTEKQTSDSYGNTIITITKLTKIQ